MVTKRLSFARWLRTTGQITDREFLTLNDEWSRVRPKTSNHKVYTTGPVTWDQFLAGKYPRQFIVYQAFLRLTGGALTLKKD